MSNDEAIKVLLEDQNYDPNIILHDTSAIYKLLSTSSYVDFNILNYLLKYCRPDVNSGCKLPLNQAITKGNLLIIRTLLELSRPDFRKMDMFGKAAVHVAGDRYDKEVFEMLVKKGADPNLPDKDGNTVLHYMCDGTVRDTDYEFIQELVTKYKCRLIRNNEN